MTDRVLSRVERLRAEFDHSFAVPLRTLDDESVELLAVGVGGRAYALRLSQTSGLYPNRPVTPLPTTVPALRGLAGFAGVVVPVYDLAALLGHPIAEQPRWLVLAAGSPPLALAFHQLDHHVRVPSADVVDGSGAASSRGCLRGMVRLPDGDRPIVDVPATRVLAHRMAGHEHPEVSS
ncbi:chemotaxis protein CheW [Actinoplanes sp. SE50]|uniref:chemotaxis protein CheW n=1 Tax=unclassified Actinoplanes TaxID=2626549 RepID=UPI00023ECD1F|nr:MULTISPECIES: chemotaxis protein CheW [unclassified Actinoplanes]AEV86025.1 Chemotaxis protein cheW [Actinoplanes sp. SE50/110]ATO84423.1 chemotaxis protein CheW [Actinoplanes sp. SE50]SLM01833.1 chemotaxis protein CheW [Actinoplanes sp. SE50/110]